MTEDEDWSLRFIQVIQAAQPYAWAYLLQGCICPLALQILTRGSVVVGGMTRWTKRYGSNELSSNRFIEIPPLFGRRPTGIWRHAVTWRRRGCGAKKNERADSKDDLEHIAMAETKDGMNSSGYSNAERKVREIQNPQVKTSILYHVPSACLQPGYCIGNTALRRRSQSYHIPRNTTPPTYTTLRRRSQSYHIYIYCITNTLPGWSCYRVYPISGTTDGRRMRSRRWIHPNLAV